jgi:hypothetical protein
MASWRLKAAIMLAVVTVTGCRCGPAPAFEVSPQTVDFGALAAGEVSTRTFTVRNHGAATTFSFELDLAFGQPVDFAQAAPAIDVAELASAEVTWRFAPGLGAMTGPRSARLRVLGGGEEAEVFLVGAVTAATVMDAGAADAGVFDGGAFDAGAADGGVSDGGVSDGGVSDGGVSDGGALDAGALDAGALDAGALDAGSLDAGAPDAGPRDAGTFDAGVPDAGPRDAGVPDAGNSCATACTSWTQCTQAGTGCDTSRGCCVPCGGAGQPCCVNWGQGVFFCGDGGALVCGSSTGSGGTVGYFCCANQGDGCCQQGGCSGSTCCKCPRNGLNFCVQSSFGCGGC